MVQVKKRKEKMDLAAQSGDVEDLRENLRQNPTHDVNHRYRGGWTLLHVACYNDSDSVLPLLLEHPDIDVNQKDDWEQTPFILSFERGHVACIRRMLKDSRVKVNEPNDEGHTPLWPDFPRPRPRTSVPLQSAFFSYHPAAVTRENPPFLTL